MVVYNHIHHSHLQQVAMATTIEHLLGYAEQCKEIREGGGKEGGRRGREVGRERKDRRGRWEMGQRKEEVRRRGEGKGGEEGGKGRRKEG